MDLYKYVTLAEINTALLHKQDTLVSGSNIKTVDGNSLLGSGNIVVSPTGSFMWFTGNIGEAPSGYLVCNGQAVSRTDYANLFAVIGTKYGVGDGSTTFNLPDLSDGNGRFIRAGFTDSAIGTKQDDAIRNITGRMQAYCACNNNLRSPFGTGYGAFTTSTVSTTGEYPPTGATNNWSSNWLSDFSANTNTNSYGNPMAGHANGGDIHPYNIAFLPLIAY